MMGAVNSIYNNFLGRYRRFKEHTGTAKRSAVKVAYIFPPPWDPKYPSYAMALFKSSTRQAGQEFVGFDLNVDLYNYVSNQDKQLWKDQFAVRWVEEGEQIIERYSGFLNSYVKRILNSRANLYAIYVLCYTKTIAFHLAGKIKERDPKAAIIFGGPQCFPAYDGTRILENRFVDAICTGEGDLVWPKMLDWFSMHGNLHIDIPGISYKTSTGAIVDGGVPELVKDLNTVPFADYSGIDLSTYSDVNQVSIMTSRGCINSCAFCSERPNFSKYRRRSAENILNEVLTIVRTLQSSANKQMVPYINFNDSLINGSPRELSKFCELVIECGVKFNWSGMALIRKEMSSELLPKMKEAGCCRLAWGLESGSQRVLTLMHKRFFTMELAKRVIKDTYDAGILQSISMVVGFPGETEDMFEETVQFLREYNTYFAGVGAQPMMIVPNSAVHDHYQDFGVDFVNSREYLRWQTLDASNTYDVRLKRLELIKSVLDGRIMTIDK